MAASIAISENYGKDVRYCSNRKEIKDHGDKGILLGSPLQDGDRVVIIEDVTTAGTSIRETMPILSAQGKVQPVGLVVSVDRMERGTGEKSALEEIEERLDLITRLTRKYNCLADELPALAEKMQTRLDELIHYDKNRGELAAACKTAKKEAEAAAAVLSEKRRATAKEFAEKVKAEMSFLNMPNVELVPAFETIPLSPKGIDKVELLISANPGETPRPVAKIASGGELSRMMLAIKTVLAGTDMADTLIFDEVDTGISGSAAEKVGLKLSEVSKECQVLCVTHQAQIAALADFHYLIRKQVEQGRTFTEVVPLDHSGRVSELARIIGGVSITEAAVSHAEDMLRIYHH